MNPYPQQFVPDPAAVRSKDEGDLNTLSILHWVWTALLGCMSVGMVGYFILIAGFVANAPSGPHSHPGDQQMAAGVIGVMGVVMFLIMVPLFVLHVLAAAGLKKRTRYMLTFVIACLTCMSFPLGTALGVWTIMVLQRPSVKALYGRV